MFNFRQTKRYLPLITPLLLVSHYNCIAKPEEKVELGIGTTIALTAGAVAGAAALGTALYTYFTYQTPQEILHESEALAATIAKRYQEVLSLPVTRCFDEPLLLRYGRALLGSQRMSLSGDIEALTKAITKTCKAGEKAETYHIERDLAQCMQDLKKLKTGLLYVQSVRHDYKSYFDLFELVEAIRYNHYDERQVLRIQDLCPLPQEPSYIREKLRAALHIRNLKYPYLEYAQIARVDIQRLRSTLTETSSHYMKLKHDAEFLLKELTWLYECVINDPEYNYEKERWEQARREQERLELERERLRMEQQRVYLERERMREEKRARQEERMWREWREERQREREERQTSHVEITISCDE